MLFIFLVIFGLSSNAPAQEQPDRFDPIAYIATLNIYQEYGEGVFVMPPNATRTYMDSIWVDTYVVAFTIKNHDKNPDGWTLWMDFDADRYGSTRLVRVFAQKRVEEVGEEALRKLDKWTQSVLTEKIRDRLLYEGNELVWKWIPQANYMLKIKLISQKENNSRYLTISLDREEISGN